MSSRFGVTAKAFDESNMAATRKVIASSRSLLANDGADIHSTPL